MIIKTVKVSDKGQIAIPQDIREALSLEKGDELLIIEDKGRILLQQMAAVQKHAEDDFNDLETHSLRSLKDVWDNKKDDIWSSYL